MHKTVIAIAGGVFVSINAFATTSLAHFFKPTFVPTSGAALTIYLHDAAKYPYLGLSINNHFLGAESSADVATVELSSTSLGEMVLVGYVNRGDNTFDFYGCQDKDCKNKIPAQSQSTHHVNVEGYINYSAAPNAVTVDF